MAETFLTFPQCTFESHVPYQEEIQCKQVLTQKLNFVFSTLCAVHCADCLMNTVEILSATQILHEIMKFQPSKIAKYHLNQNSKPPKLQKMAVCNIKSP